MEVYTAPEALAKLIKALTDAQAQAQAFANAASSAKSFRDALVTPVPTTPVEPPVVIELPAPVEPTPKA